MNKSISILVFDEMPNSCAECDVICTGYTEKEYSEKGIKRPSWCPLRPLPQKKHKNGGSRVIDGVEWYYDSEHDDGWNDCLDEILGETEDK